MSRPLSAANAERIVHELARSSTLDEFFAKIFSGTGESRVAYATVARRAGFASRAFPREVAQGRRRLTLATLPRFQKALYLTGKAATFFHWLAALHTPKLNNMGWSEEELRARLEKLRPSLLNWGQERLKEQSGTSLYRLKKWPQVFAMLTPEGLTEAEVSVRAGVSVESCREILNVMTRHELVRRQGQSYFPMEKHFHLVERVHKGAFQEFYLDSVRKIQRIARERFMGDEHLFFNSVFSVSRSEMPRLKKELRELMLKFVMESEGSSDDHYATLVCGLLPR